MHNRTLSRHDSAYVKKIPGIELHRIGQLINQGVHHRVYSYGKHQVIKIPRKRFDFLYSTKSLLESDLLLLEKFFPNFLVKTQVVASPDHKHHCVLQEKVETFEYITPQVLQKYQKEFALLELANTRLWQAQKASLDLIGGEGFLSCFYSMFNQKKKPYFSNAVIYKGHIRLLDSELLRLSLRSFSSSEIIRWVLSFNSMILNKICLKFFS